MYVVNTKTKKLCTKQKVMSEFLFSVKIIHKWIVWSRTSTGRNSLRYLALKENLNYNSYHDTKVICTTFFYGCGTIDYKQEDLIILYMVEYE